jgi:lipoprotein-releasing system permease protein
MEWFIALRYLRGKTRFGSTIIITIVSALGVFLGSGILVVALSITNGFESEVRDRIVGTLAHVRLLQYHGKPILNSDSLRQEVLKHPQVVAASPYISGKGGIEKEQIQEGVMILGIDPHYEAAVTELQKTIINGVFSVDSALSNRQRKLPGILIGTGLADKMGVQQSSEVVLMSVTEVDGAIDPVPKMTRFVVDGVFETGMYEYDLSLVFISIPSAQNLFNMRGVEGLRIRTADMMRAGPISRSIQDFVGGYPYRTVDWQSQNKSLFQWMKLEKLVIFIVISMIMGVASFNIISSLIMMISEKRREIGILMSMGAQTQDIRKIFLIYGTFIGLIGSTVGTGLGLLLCFIQYRWHLIPLPGDIYFIDMVPILIKPFDIIGVYVAANLICISASFFPAWRASRILPAESIRYE